MLQTVRNNIANPKVLPEKFDDIECEACNLPKSTRKIPKDTASPCSDILEKIHSDIWGPALTESPEGKRYFISFINEKSRYAEVIFIQEQSEAFNAIKEFTNRIENQTGKKIKIFKSDNAQEYVSKKVRVFL
jgi:hypothetical protein